MKNINTLSKYPSGSFRELLSISLPLMLTAMSASLMMFGDRLILAHYSLDAMNSVVGVSMVVFLFIFAGVGITSVSEVFVGQHNGAGQYKELATPVWQMIWFSLLLIIVLWPVALWFYPFFIASKFALHGTDYFRWLMAFGFLLPISTAISGFFIGRGKIKMVTVAMVTGNLINLGLDIIFIYGYQDIIPAYGAKGAAWATIFAQLVQAAILFAFFLNKYNRTNFHTDNYKWSSKEFKACLKIGVPNAVGHAVEISAWSILLAFLANVGMDYITVQNIDNSLFILVAFLNEGLQKGIGTISANLLGSNNQKNISKLLKSGILLHCICVLIISIPCLLAPKLYTVFLITANEATPYILEHAELALYGFLIFYIFDGLVWTIAGVLMAGGDTKFIMYANSIAVWIFFVIPTYFVFKYFETTPSTVFLYLAPMYSGVNFILFLMRYNSGNWVKLQLNKQIEEIEKNKTWDINI